MGVSLRVALSIHTPVPKGCLWHRPYTQAGIHSIAHAADGLKSVATI